MFGVLHSGSGETALQINVIGNMETGKAVGFVDILASDCHMRWLQPAPDTLPCAWRDWVANLADFVVVFPVLDVNQLLGEKGTGGVTLPWATCRQCLRKEKTPLAMSKFYHSAKHTNK